MFNYKIKVTSSYYWINRLICEYANKLDPPFNTRKAFITSVFIVLLLVPMYSQSYDESRISKQLLERAIQYPDNLIEVEVLLKDQIDLEKIIRHNHNKRNNHKEIVSDLLKQLQTKAETSQSNLLTFLKSQREEIRHSIRPLWIRNMVLLKANFNLLAALSIRPDVQFIYPLTQPTLLDVAQSHSSIEISSTSESGLKTINAHKMWELGYTGYGRKAFIMDLGEDQYHPAINSQYYGNYVHDSHAWSGYGRPEVGVLAHGTHVTGTICGLDRLEKDTIGVAFNGLWMGGPIILDKIYYEQEVRSIPETFQWALDPDNNPNTMEDMPDVINCSWGRIVFECGDYHADIADILELAGIAVVWAAGNSGPDTSTIIGFQNWNKSLVNTFTVGALQQDGLNTIADFSSRGPSSCPGEASLKIKPEVSAPGVNVRSCTPGGEYASWQGTSMASPHVAGAILLLKEAFPYLLGEELKLALYFSAIDLGIPGEDNEYGMGLIDVYAAYLYLIDQGHTPIPPVSTANDIILAGVKIEDIYCDEIVSYTVFIENNGSDTVFRFVISTYSDQLNPSFFPKDTFEGILFPGEIEEIVFTYNRDAILSQKTNKESYLDVHITISEPNGKKDLRPLNNSLSFQALIPQPLIPDISFNSLNDTNTCVGTHALINTKWDNPHATSKWFEKESIGISFATTNHFITPLLEEDITFYISPIFNQLGASLPKAEDLLFEFPPDSAGLLLRVEQPLKLQSTKVFTEENGGLIIQLCDQNNDCKINTFYLQKGENTIKLKQILMPGRTYKLYKLNGINIGYQFDHEGYPYKYDDLLSIIGPAQGSPAEEGYYYFYNFEAEPLYTCQRIPVDISVSDTDNPPLAEFTIADTIMWVENESIAFINNSTNSDEWFWDFGDGRTSTDQHPMHIYGFPGYYNVTLESRDTESHCSDFIQKLIYLEPANTTANDDDQYHFNEEDIIIYPNPASIRLIIRSELDNHINSIVILNSLGKIIDIYSMPNRKNNVYTLDIQRHPEGMYILHFLGQDQHQLGSKKLIINR